MCAGNEAPEASVDALYLPDGQTAPLADNANVSEHCGQRDTALKKICMQWREILPRVPLGPSSRHLFKIPPTSGLNYVKLNMYPDGGIVGLPAPMHWVYC